MSQPHVLIAERTITQERHHLTVRVPIRVMSHAFARLDGGVPPSYEDPAYRCGTEVGPPEVQREICPHDHQHFEIFLILGGTALHRTPLYVASLSRGDVVISAPGQTHAWSQIDGIHRMECVYLAEWLVHEAKELWSEPGVLPLFLAQGPPGTTADLPVQHFKLTEQNLTLAFEDLRAMVLELERSSPSLPYLKRCMGKLMITLGRSYAETEMEGTGGGMRQEVLEALRLIERAAATGEPFRASELAQSCGLSVTSFVRQFCESVGRSPLQYFQQRRIQHACWLLLHAEQSVTEVAFSLGYADAPHFVRVFHKMRGMTPSDYRKRFRDKPKQDDVVLSPERG